MRDAVIVEAVRTPVGKGKPGGAYADVHPVDLHAHAIRSAVERLPGLDPAEIDDVIGGVVGQVGEQSGNTTRYAALAAGLPESVPGVTVDRQCGSSQQALSFAAQGVQRVEGRRLVVHPLLAHGAGGAGNPRRRGARGVHGHGHGRGRRPARVRPGGRRRAGARRRRVRPGGGPRGRAQPPGQERARRVGRGVTRPGRGRRARGPTRAWRSPRPPRR
jgi:hypothetical protein